MERLLRAIDRPGSRFINAIVGVGLLALGIAGLAGAAPGTSPGVCVVAGVLALAFSGLQFYAVTQRPPDADELT